MPVTQVHPGLFVMTPHGVGMVMSVRQDGMVVTKLTASATTGGGPAFTGYFHPSSIDPLAAAVPSFSAAASFQPVSPAAYGGFQLGQQRSTSMTDVAPRAQSFRALEMPCSGPPSKRRRSSDFGLRY